MRTRRAAADQIGIAHDSTKDRPIISMAEAVGYAALPCNRESPVSDALAIKHDRLFLLTDQEGNVSPPGNCSLGLFEDDTRILSHYEIRVAGTPQSRLSTQMAVSYTHLTLPTICSV